nr:hypothetical protein [uncultured Mediterranean phage uvMED]
MSQECYVCLDCGQWHQSYAHLKHYDEHNGGFCINCDSSNCMGETEVDEDDWAIQKGRLGCSIEYDDSHS